MFGLDDIAAAALAGAGWGVGFVAVLGAAAIGAPRARPIFKRAMRGYLTAADRVKEWTAESSERVRDLYAEAKYEYQQQLSEAEAETTTQRAEHEAEPTTESNGRKARPRRTRRATSASTTG